MRLALASCLFIIPLIYSNLALAFDCAKATTDTEKTICAQPALKAVDDAMSAAYQTLAATLEPATKDQLKISQRNFIANRDYCGTDAIGCIMDRTVDRIQFLNGGAEAGAVNGAMPQLKPLLVQQTGDAKKGLYTIDYVASVFANPASDGEKAFNAAMQKRMTGAPLGPQKDMIEYATSNAWEQSVSTRITLLTDIIISAEIEEYSYEGGAHGNGGVSSVSLDRKTGAVVDVAAMLGKQGVADLVPVCRDQIITVKSERQASYDPATPYDIAKDNSYSDETVRDSLSEPSSWRLEPGKATVTFNSYALGSYAEGRYECGFDGALLSALTGGKLNLR